MLLLPGLVGYQFFKNVLLPGWHSAKALAELRQTKLLLPRNTPSLALVPSSRDNKRHWESIMGKARWGSTEFSTVLEGLEVQMRVERRHVDTQGRPIVHFSHQEAEAVLPVSYLTFAVGLPEDVPTELSLLLYFGLEAAELGPEALAAGLVNGQINHLFTDGDSLDLRDGVLVVHSAFAVRDQRNAAMVEEIVRTALRLGQHSSSGKIDYAQLLKENLEQDEDARVRARTAEVLIRNFPELSDWAAATALGDGHAEVRFTAARLLGPEGYSLAEQIAYPPQDQELEGIDSGLRQRALRYLVRELEQEELLVLLKKCLDDGPEVLRQIALRKLAVLRHGPSVRWMEALLPVRDVNRAVAGCEALEALADPAGEGILLQMLEYPDEELQKSAVDALAQLGTYGALPRLREISKRAQDRGLRLAASTVVLMIQSRGIQQHAGALAVVEPDEQEGRMSLANPSDSLQTKSQLTVPSSD